MNQSRTHIPLCFRKKTIIVMYTFTVHTHTHGIHPLDVEESLTHVKLADTATVSSGPLFCCLPPLSSAENTKPFSH